MRPVACCSSFLFAIKAKTARAAAAASGKTIIIACSLEAVVSCPLQVSFRDCRKDLQSSHPGVGAVHVLRTYPLGSARYPCGAVVASIAAFSHAPQNQLLAVSTLAVIDLLRGAVRTSPRVLRDITDTTLVERRESLGLTLSASHIELKKADEQLRCFRLIRGVNVDDAQHVVS